MKPILKVLVLFLSVLTLAVGSCVDENEIPDFGNQAQITFGLGITTPVNGRVMAVDTPSKLLVTIMDAEGTIILNQESIDLLPFGNDYISEPVTLIPGDFTVTEFLVLNEGDTVIYAAPLDGSEKANLVDNPLPVAFTVATNQVTHVNIEVLPVADSTPEDFGYATFGFSLIGTFDFQLAVFCQDSATGRLETIPSSLSITPQNRNTYTLELDAGSNLITLRNDIQAFELNFSSVGKAFVYTYTKDSLEFYSPNSGNGTLNIVISNGTDSSSNTGIFIDERDGQAYRYVKIGSQTWMADNLNYGNLVSPSELDIISISDSIPEKSCITNDCSEGGFYNWYEVMQTNNPDDAILSSEQSDTIRNGLCPTGWHVPTLLEYQRLINYVGQNIAATAYTKLVDVNANQPLNINGGDNESGFSLKLQGLLRLDETTGVVGESAFLWTSTRGALDPPKFTFIRFDNSTIQYPTANSEDTFLMNCRCVKD